MRFSVLNYLIYLTGYERHISPSSRVACEWRVRVCVSLYSVYVGVERGVERESVCIFFGGAQAIAAA
jgi:hypothetical protein